MADNPQLIVELKAVDLLGQGLDSGTAKLEQAGKKMSDALTPSAPTQWLDDLSRKSHSVFDGMERDAAKAGKAIDLALNGFRPAARRAGSVRNTTDAIGGAGTGHAAFTADAAANLADSAKSVDKVEESIKRLDAGSTGASLAMSGLGASTGLTVTSLIGLGIALPILSRVVDLLVKGAAAGYDFDKSVSGLPLVAKAGAHDIEDLKSQINDLTQEFGVFSREQVTSAFLSARSNGRTSADAQTIAQAAAPLSAGDPSKFAGDVQLLNDVMLAYGDRVSDAAQAENDFFVAAREAHGDVRLLERAVLGASAAFDQYGVSRREVTASFAAAKESNPGLAFDQASTDAQRLLSVIVDETDSTHIALTDVGADISRNALETQGWLFELHEINKALAAHPEVKDEFFSGPRQKGVTSLIGGDSSDILTKQRNELAALIQASEVALNTVSGQLDRTAEHVKAPIRAIGDFLAGTAGALLGTEHDATVPLHVAPEIVGFDDAIRKAFSSGDVERAIAESGKFEKSGRLASAEFVRGVDEAMRNNDFAAIGGVNQDLKAFQEKFLQSDQVLKFDPLVRMNEVLQGSDAIVVSIEGHLKRLVGVARDSAGGITKVFEDTGKFAGPFSLGESRTPGQIKIDELQRGIQKSLQGLPPIDLPIPFRFQVVPDLVRDAQSKLEKISASLDTGARPSDQQRTEAAQSEGVIAQYKAQQAQSDLLILSLQARTATGLERQRSENNLIEAQIQGQIDQYKAAGIAVDGVEAQLRNIKGFDAKQIEIISDKQTSDIGLKNLQLRAQAIEKERDLAAASGDTAQADKLSLDLIQAKSQAQLAANDAAITAMRIQFEGNAEALAGLDDYAAMLLEVQQSEDDLAGATERRGRDKRAADNAAELVGLQRELLTGLDAELAGIEDNVQARREQAEEAKAAGKIDIDGLVKRLFLLDQIELKEIDLAKLHAAEDVQTTTLEIERGIAVALGDQLANLEAIRALQGKQLERRLNEDNASPEDKHRALFDFDQETATQIRAQKIAFAQRSAASIAEQALIEKAAADGVNLSLQEQIDLISRAKDGAEALGAGFKAGFTDALRSLNDFDSGLQASHDLVLGFRDSLVEAFDGVGQHGHNFLKDFGISELKNIQHTFATLASNSITSGLGGLLGLGGANQADPLAASGATLTTAGIGLNTAAVALETAAFTLGASGIAGGLGGGISNVLGSTLGTDTAGTSLFGIFPGGATGGVVYGFANGGIGRNGRKRTDSRDVIPALLRKNEYVLTPEQVSAAGGVGYLDSLNSGGGAGRARQRVTDSTPSRVVHVGGNSVTLGDIHVHVTGEAANDPQAIARAVRDQVVPAVTAALESGSSRRLIEAVRGAAR